MSTSTASRRSRTRRGRRWQPAPAARSRWRRPARPTTRSAGSSKSSPWKSRSGRREPASSTSAPAPPATASRARRPRGRSATGAYGANLSNQRGSSRRPGGYRIRSLNSNQYLTASAATAGASVAQQAQAASSSQYFWLIPQADGYSAMVNVAEGCSAAYWAVSKGRRSVVVDLEADTGSDGQRWSADRPHRWPDSIVAQGQGAGDRNALDRAKGGGLAQQGDGNVLNRQWALEFIASVGRLRPWVAAATAPGQFGAGGTVGGAGGRAVLNWRRRTTCRTLRAPKDRSVGTSGTARPASVVCASQSPFHGRKRRRGVHGAATEIQSGGWRRSGIFGAQEFELVNEKSALLWLASGLAVVMACSNPITYSRIGVELPDSGSGTAALTSP